MLRVGKNVEHFKAAAVAADTKGDAVLRYCAVGRQLGYAAYLTLDMVSYVSTGGVPWAWLWEREGGWGERRQTEGVDGGDGSRGEG